MEMSLWYILSLKAFSFDTERNMKRERYVMILDGISFLMIIFFIAVVFEYALLIYLDKKHDKPNTDIHDFVVEEWNRKH